MRVLITGARGMVARAVKRAFEQNRDDVIALGREELDIADIKSVAKCISSINPDAIVNCAAYTNVDGCEDNQGKCFAGNRAGVKNLALSAKEQGSIFLTISTDYVFDGEKQGFYNEFDRANPLSVYGKSKYEGEGIAAEIYSSSIILRTGWIFGEGGTNFLSVMPRFLSEGKKIKVVNDAFGTPTYAADLAKRIRELVFSNEFGVFHVTNSGEGTSYLGFAEKICAIGNFDRSLIEGVSESKLSRPAPRPTNSRLACLRTEQIGLEPLPHWEKALEIFVKECQ